MLFDFDKFSRIATSVYNDNNLYSFDDCLSVFRYYFEKYEEFAGRVHPPIRASQIARIMQDMPYIDEHPDQAIVKELKEQFPNWNPVPDIYPDEYPYIIIRHFETKYRNCDYNINHFFSGKIRRYRAIENGRIEWSKR